MADTPTTEAGKRLSADRDACLGVQCKHATDVDILAIEAEAVAAERARIRSAATLRPAQASGPRRLTFGNGRYEDYWSVTVEHPSGRWDRILIARDDGSVAEAVAAAINGVVPDTRLREAAQAAVEYVYNVCPARWFTTAEYDMFAALRAALAAAPFTHNGQHRAEVCPECAALAAPARPDVEEEA